MANHVREHQTLVVIHVDANNNYQSRVRRLIESLNGEQIKTDYITVDDDGRILSGIPTELSTEDEPVEFNTPYDLAKHFGYVMVLRVSTVEGMAGSSMSMHPASQPIVE